MPRTLNATEKSPDLVIYQEEPRLPEAEDPKVKLEIEMRPGRKTTFKCRLSEVPRICRQYGVPLPAWYAEQRAAVEKRLHGRVEDKAVRGPARSTS